MILKLARLGALAFACLLVFDACSGSGGHTVPATPIIGKSAADQRATLKILIPKKSTSTRARNPRYVSPATAQMAINIQTGCPGSCTSVAGYPTTVALTPTSTGCSSTLAGTSCQLVLPLPPNSYTVTLTAEDAQGSALSTAQSVALAVVAGMNNTLSVTLSGIPSTITAAAIGANAFLVEALDVDNNVIAGAGAPTYAIAQTSGTLNLQQPTTVSPNIFYATPTAAGTASITVTASYGNGLTDGCSQTGAHCSAAFTLTTTQESDMFVSEGGTSVVRLAPPYTGSPITTTSKGLDDPTGIAFNAAGDLFVGNYSLGSVTEYAFPYTGSPIATITSGLVNPTGVAFDSKNDLFVSDAGTNAVQEFAPPYTGPALLVLTNLDLPEGIALDSSDDVFVSSYGSGTVYEYPPNGTGPISGVGGFKNPDGLTVDAKGNVYVANFGGNNVLESAAPFPSMATQLIGGLTSPESIALDPSNHIYVGQYGLGNIVSYAPPYTGSQIAGPILSDPQSIAFRNEFTTTIQPSL